MKKLILIFSLILVALVSYSQDVVGSRVIAKQSVFIRDRWIDSVLVDTSLFQSSNRSIPTAGAVYEFVVNRAAGSPGSGTVTSVSFTGGLISVADPTTTPAFTVAGTSGGIPYFSSSSTWASSAALAANAIVIGGGAGAAPSTTTTGTGVLTALGVNVGSAGAFVTFNGAGGTPSSITLTNATGTASALNIGGNAATATILQTARNINGVSFNGSTDITVTAAAGTLTGTTLNATVVTSSLTSVGTLTTGTASTGFVVAGVTMTLGSDASFDMYYRDGSGVLTRLANGTDNQVLTAHTGAAPTWEAGGGGGSSLFPTTGTGTATGNVIGDLDGNTLAVQQAGENFLLIDPTAFSSSLFGSDGTGVSYLRLFGDVTGGDVYFELKADDDSNPTVTIKGDAVSGDIVYNSPNGHTFIGAVITQAVTTSAGTAGLYLTSGTLLTTPEAGAIEYDGNTAYVSTATGRGYWPSVMFARLTSNFTLTDNNSAQPAFSSGLDVWTLQASTTYEFEGVYHLNMGTTNHLTQMGFTLGGGASLTSIYYTIFSWNNAPGSTQTAQLTNYVNVATVSTASLFNASTTITIIFKGMMSVNAGGTVSPFIQFSAAPGGTNEMTAGSYIKFTPIGTNVVQSVGPVQ